MATCGIGDFLDDVMVILFGSGGLKVTVSSRIDPFPPWDSNLRPTHQTLKSDQDPDQDPNGSALVGLPESGSGSELR